MSLPIPSRRAFDAEAAIASRRESEDRRRSAWGERADYLRATSARAQKDAQWGSLASFSRSMDTFRLAAQQEARNTRLMERRGHLRELLRRERVQHASELRRSRPSSRDVLTSMRARSAELRTQRETRRDTLAHDKRVQAAAERDPEVRAIESARLRNHVERERVQQIEQRAATQRAQEQASREELEERARDWERRQQQEREQLRLRRQAAGELQQALRAQMDELSAREQEADNLRAAYDAVQREQLSLARAEIERQQRAEQEQAVRYSRALRAQVKQQMLDKSRLVREELERDAQLLEDVARAQASERAARTQRRVDAEANVAWMREEVQRQREVEQERARQLDALYRDEAARVFAKQEQRWDQERAARQRLMAEVFTARQHQLEEKLVRLEQRQAQSIADREHLLTEIDAKKRAAEAEDRARQEEERRVTQAWSEQAEQKRREQEARERMEEERIQRQRAEEEQLRAEARQQATTRRRAAAVYTPPRFGRKRVAWD